MTLEEFIIRIKLVGGAAAADLRKITNASSKTKDSLNATGASADRLNKKLGKTAKNANSAQNALTTIVRSARLGGGFGFGRFGGGGLSLSGGAVASAVSSLGSLGPAGAVAVVALGGLAVATGAAVLAIGRLRKVQDAEADAALGLTATRADGSVKSFAENRAERAAVSQKGREQLKYTVDGKNVFGNVGREERVKGIAALLKNNIDLKDIDSDVEAAYHSLGALGEGISEQDKARAIEAAVPLAKERMKRTGQQFGQALLSESANALMLASVTALDPREAVRAVPKGVSVQRLNKWKDSEAYALLALFKISTGKTGRNAADVLTAILTKAQVPRKKQKELDDALGIAYESSNGALKGGGELFKLWNEIEGRLGPAKFSEYLEKRFTPKMALEIATLRGAQDQYSDLVTKFDFGSTASIENALLAKAETISFAEARLGVAFDNLLLVFGQDGGIGGLYVAVINDLALFIDDFASGLQDFILSIVAMGKAAVLANNYKFAEARDVIAGVISAQEARRGARGDVGTQSQRDTGKQGASAAVAATIARGAQVSDIKTEVIRTAAEVEKIAAEGKATASVFTPILTQAQAFATALPLFVRGARFGVQSELLQMLATMYQMSVSYRTAGLAIGQGFNAGLNAGFAGTAGVARAPARIPTQVRQPQGVGATSTAYNTINVNGAQQPRAVANEVDRKLAAANARIRHG